MFVSGTRFCVLAAVLATAADAFSFAPSVGLRPTGVHTLDPVRRAASAVAPACFTVRPSLAHSRAQSAAGTRAQSGLSSLSMQESFGVVITGAAGGVGYAYADEFLSRGHRVVMCDISPKISTAADALRKKHPNAQVFETTCDVSDKDSVEALADFSKRSLGIVNYWINNAGINGGRRYFMEVPIDEVERVVNVNLKGALLCTHYAMHLLAEQQGVTGHIFNTVGSGVKGGGTPGYVCYGATKRGQPQMTASLADELTKGVQGFDVRDTAGEIKVHTLSPGMVFTQLLLQDSTPELRKFPFGVLAAQPEEVAQDLVPKILSTTEQGSSVEFLTTDKILLKFFQRFVLQQKSKYIDDDGNVIKMPDQQYDADGVRALF